MYLISLFIPVMHSRESYSLYWLLICSYAVASLATTFSSSNSRTPTPNAAATAKYTTPTGTDARIKISEQRSNLNTCESNKVFHNETQKCYYHAGAPLPLQLKLESSPCGKLMYFYSESKTSPYGVCDCINDDNCIFSVDFHRPVLNWPGSNRCYYAYEQGPCKPGEWIVMNKKTFQSECRINPCIGKKLESVPSSLLGGFEKPDIDTFWFEKNGTCYQTLTEAYCKPDEYVRFLRTNPFPFFINRDSGQGCGSIGTTATLPCPQGHKRVGDDCAPVVDIQ